MLGAKKPNLNKLAIFVALFAVTLAFGESSIAAPDAACLAKLARGENRFGEPLPLPALKRLASGMRHYTNYLGQERFALLVDYTRNSRFKRGFLIDFETCDIKSEEYVIHGGSVYHPDKHYGDPEQDGMLKYCKRPDGTSQNMTRPGLYMTWGCHQTQQSNWTQLGGNCQGVKLVGLERQNREAFGHGIVLHEHTSIPNDASVKLAGQGCPAFPPGRLQQMLKFNLFSKAMVLVYAPQCEGANVSPGAGARPLQPESTVR